MLGQALGLTDRELDALQGDYRASSLFSDREKAALAWSEAMTLNTAKRDDAVWADLRGHFSDGEIVEVSLACAMFNMINRLNDSFRTELEPEEHNRRQHGAVGVTAKALEDYACRICAGGKA
ncbi:MAG: carboxymuconolactone decarboxylase family protein [Betaproteobacteria bacterium]